MTPVLPYDFAALTLPDSRSRLEAVRDVIVAGVGPETLAELSRCRLGEICPMAADLPGGPADDERFPLRLRNALAVHGAKSWTKLARLKLSEVSAVTNVGPKATLALLRFTVSAAVEFLGASLKDPPASADDVRTLLALGSETGSDLHRALVGYLTPDQSETVRAAAERLLALERSDLARSPVGEVLAQVLAAAGDTRDRVMFERLVLQLEHAPSAASLARLFGTSGQRIAGVRDRAVARVQSAASRHREQLAALMKRVADDLGTAAPLSVLGGLVEEQGLRSLEDPRLLLLVWMAGPYRPVPGHSGWVARDPSELVSESFRALHEDGGVRPPGAVRRDLLATGLAERHVDSWLERQPVRIVHDLVVAVTGSGADVGERVLNATGKSMTTGELSDWLQLLSTSGDPALKVLRDRRFLRVGPEDWELAEWGGVRFNPPLPVDDPEGEFTLVIRVDDATLAGAEDTISDVLAESLCLADLSRQSGDRTGKIPGANARRARGTRAGVRRIFATRFGPLALSYDGVSVTRGSVRPIALAAGALPGDMLVVEFRPDADEARVELRASTGRSGSLF
jgi:hypothetical protein